jgi:hypothetical protein
MRAPPVKTAEEADRLHAEELHMLAYVADLRLRLFEPGSVQPPSREPSASPAIGPPLAPSRDHVAAIEHATKQDLSSCTICLLT